MASDMEFRNLKRQYEVLKKEIDSSVEQVMTGGGFIGGEPVAQLEKKLAEYVGVKHCITCGNGTDALQLALMAWKIGPGDAVFVPDFTFFSSAEVIAAAGAVPIFVDVCQETFNIDTRKLKEAIESAKKENKYRLKAIIAVDLFGLPADYPELRKLAAEYDLLLLEDGAQGFGGKIDEKRVCSFGDISTTSFFPAKPLGCYGDGGAVFTDNDEWAELIRSYKVHGKGKDKYDNVRIGINSRLDTIQAAVLLVKFKAFVAYELIRVNEMAEYYTKRLKDIVQTPCVYEGRYSSWAQYTILLQSEEQRDAVQKALKEQQIPSMVYYSRPLHEQTAFRNVETNTVLHVSSDICKRVLSLPMSPYLTEEEAERVVSIIRNVLESMQE